MSTAALICVHKMDGLRVIDDKRQIVAECPLWDEKRNILYTIDILGKTVRSTDLNTLQHTEVTYPQEIGCIVLREDGRLVGAMRDGVYDLNSDGTMTPICVPEKLKGRRFNDGKVGPDGRLYVGTTDANHLGAFYRVDKDGNMVELLDHMGCSNGLSWTSDRRTLYLVDSPDRMIYAFDFDSEKGEISNRRRVMEVPSPVGEPDGMTIDAEDKLWLAVWGGNAFYRIDPVKREVMEKHEMNVSEVSSCGFAGEKLETLIITSAALRLEHDEEDAGKTFALNVNVRGVSSWRFGVNSNG